MAAHTILSLEEFLNLPPRGPNGTHHELHKGELIQLSPGGTIHSIVVTRIAAYLDSILDPAEYAVLSGEAGIVFEYPDTISVRGTDVAVIRANEDEKYPEGMQRIPFLLAVEVISKSNDPEYVEQKRDEYLENGIRELWLVYPKTQTVHVYKGSRSSASIYYGGESFTSLGQEIQVGRLFRR